MKLVYASLGALPFTAATLSSTYDTIRVTAPLELAGTDVKTSYDDIDQADQQLANAAETQLDAISTADLIICDQTTAISRPGLTNGNVNQVISNLNFDYAMGMILEADYDRAVAGLLACLTNNQGAVSNADRDTLNSMKGQISSYANRPGLDWTQLATETNPTTTGTFTQLDSNDFTPAMQKSYYNNMKIWTASHMSTRYPITGVSQAITFNDDLGNGLTWASFTTGSNFDGTTDNAAFELYVNEQLRLKAIGATSAFDAIRTNRQAIADAWLVGQATAITEFVNMIESRYTDFNTLNGYITANMDAYNAKSQFSPLFETITGDQSSLWSSEGDAKTAFDSIQSALETSSFVTADNWFIGMDGTTSCTDAIKGVTKYTDTYGGSARMTLSQKLHNLYLLHAFRYIDNSHMDNELDGFDACIDASGLTNTEKTDYKAGLRAADNALTQLTTAMIDIDFEKLTDLTNDQALNSLTLSTSQVSLTSEEDNSWFIADLIRVSGLASVYADFPTPGTFASGSIPSALNSFNTQAALDNEGTKQLRMYAIDGVDADEDTNDWVANFYDNRATLATVYGHTGADATQFTDAYVALKTNLDAIKARYLASKTAYEIITNPVTTAALSSTVLSVYNANTAKFTDNTAAQASYTSVNAAIVAMQPAVDYMSGLAGTDQTSCQNALRVRMGMDFTHSYSMSPDAHFMYAFRYIRAEDLDLIIQAQTDCINAVNPSNAATLVTALSSGKSAIVTYSGKIDMDWTLYTSAVNVPSTQSVSFTTDEAKSVYKGLRMGYAGLAATTAYNDLTTAQQTTLTTQLALAESLTAINALNTNDPTFGTITDWSNYGARELREYSVDKTSDYESNFVNQRDAISDALSLTGTDKTAYSASYSSTKTLTDTWKAKAASMEANYNGSGSLTFGLALLMGVVAKYVLE